MSRHHVKWLVAVFVLGVSGVLLLACGSSPRVADAQSRNTLECAETPFTLPENVQVTDACYTDPNPDSETYGECFQEAPETLADRRTGRLWYTRQDGTEEVLELSLDHSFRYEWPITVFVNEHYWGGLEALVGRQFKELTAKKIECVYNPGAGPWMKMYTYWVVWAKLSEGGGGGNGGGGGGGGGGGNATEPAQFEGFIEQINAPEVTLSKEGQSVTVTVTEDTTITLNGASATLDDLQVGDKAKATYDPDTFEALRIKAEAER